MPCSVMSCSVTSKSVLPIACALTVVACAAAALGPAPAAAVRAQADKPDF
jgi:hypothetical protein